MPSSSIMEREWDECSFIELNTLEPSFEDSGDMIYKYHCVIVIICIGSQCLYQGCSTMDHTN